MNNSILFKSVAIVVLVVIIALGAWWYFLNGGGSGKQSTYQYSASSTSYATLMEVNSSFAEADAYYKAGNYDLAKIKYQSALAMATDPVQQAQIKVKIALATDDAGDHLGAIPLFKAVAADISYPSITRAYAVQNIAFMLLQPYASSLRAAIFSGKPYSTMIADGNTTRATRRLFDYAASLYPLAVPELYSASAYATSLIVSKDKTGLILNASTTASYFVIVEDKLKLADADIARIAKDSNEVSGLAEALKRRAILIGKLALLGTKTSAEADAAYKNALNVAAPLGPGNEGYVRFYYAAYLDAAGPSRAGDIPTVLSAFYMTQNYSSSSAEQFFAGEKSNALAQKSVLKSLAKKDPSFKKYLVSLGWTSSDF